MADFHAADLWVAVLPDTSKVGPAFQKAGKDAGQQFGEGVKDIGKNVDKSLADVSKKAKDQFSKAGKESGDTFAKELTQALDKQGGSNVGKALKFSIIQGAKEASDAVVAESGKIKNAWAGAFRSGDVSGAIDDVKQKIGGISDVASKVGIDLKGWGIGADAAKAPLDDVDNTLKTTLTSATEVSSVFAGLPGKIGALAGKFAAMATEIGLVVEAGHQLYEQFSQPLDIKINASGGLGEWIEHHTPGDLGKALADAMGADKARKFFGDLFGYDPEMGHGPAAPTPSPGGPSGGAERIPYPEHFIGPIPPGGTRAPGGQWGDPQAEANRRYRDQLWGPGGQPPGTPEQEPAPGPEPRSRRRASSSPGDGGDGRGGGGGSGYRRPATPSASDRKSLYSAGSRVSNLLAFAESLVGTPYSMQLRNDCSGMVSELAAVALGLPPPAAGERFSTANEEQWLMSHGFQPGLGGPGDLNVGWHIGGPAGGHTAATLPGGVHAEQGGSHPGFLIGPGAAGAENPEFEHHAHLHMDSTGGVGPDGSKEDPLYTAPSDGDGKKSEGGSQGEDLGKGLVTGALEALGIDGSVFKSFTGKGPLDWGITKLGTGLLNWGMGTFGGQGEKSAGGGPPGTPGGSNPFAALGAMMPGTSNVGPGAGPGGGGDTNIHNAPVNQFNVTQNGVGNDSVQPWQAYTNGANYAAMTDALPTTS